MRNNTPRRAKKVGGSYQCSGTVVASFTTLTGKLRHIFEFDEPAGMLHIFGPEQVEIEADAPVEAAALTDEEIDALARKYNLDGSMLHGSRFAMYLRPFARAIETRIKGGAK